MNDAPAFEKRRGIFVKIQKKFGEYPCVGARFVL